MKKTNILYWIFTGLFGALMMFSAVPNIIVNNDSVAFLNGHLGYPIYFIPFVGTAKALGVIAIVIPGFPRIKEWAYAGLFFDLIGATYSQVALEGFLPQILFMLLPIALGALSYYFHHKKMSGSQA